MPRLRLHQLRLSARLRILAAHLQLRRLLLLPQLRRLRLPARLGSLPAQHLLLPHLLLRHLQLSHLQLLRMQLSACLPRVSARLRTKSSNDLLRHLRRHLHLPQLHPLRLSAHRWRLPAQYLPPLLFTERGRQLDRRNWRRRRRRLLLRLIPLANLSRTRLRLYPARLSAPTQETDSTPAAPAVAPKTSTGRSVVMLVTIVLVVLVVGAGVPLYNRWKRRKLLEETRGAKSLLYEGSEVRPGQKRHDRRAESCLG